MHSWCRVKIRVEFLSCKKKLINKYKTRWRFVASLGRINSVYGTNISRLILVMVSIIFPSFRESTRVELAHYYSSNFLCSYAEDLIPPLADFLIYICVALFNWLSKRVKLAMRVS